MAAPIDLSHYALLGVARDATESEIAAAFSAAVARRRSSRRARLVGRLIRGESDESLWRAYETLMDSDARSRYDASLAAEQFNGFFPQ